jgi:RNA polymerase sigma-70 factor (ECF subfamily)
MSDNVRAYESGGTALSAAARTSDEAAATSHAAAQPACPEESARLFEEGVRAHSRRLLAIARAVLGNSSRASPEDVVQQALTNLYQHRARYDWHEPGGLFKRAVVNEALRILRQPRMSLVGDDEPDVRHENGPSDAVVANETVRRVREAIARLPEHYRAALVLCEYERMPYADIAVALDASVPQIKTWIFRARRQLETMLKDYASAP